MTDQKILTNIQKQVNRLILTVDKTMISWFSVLRKVRKKDMDETVCFG